VHTLRKPTTTPTKLVEESEMVCQKDVKLGLLST
jgi:hypothetical protein